jgi:hypothetical protein
MPVSKKARALANAINRGTNRNPGLSKTQAKTVRKIAKRTAMSLAETKTVGKQTENVQLFHNKALYLQNLLALEQGTKDPNDLSNAQARIGDSVRLTNCNIKFWLSNKLDRPNCMYRLAMFWYDTTVVLSDAVVYFTQSNKMLDRYNNEQISIIDQKYIFSGPMYLNGTEKFEHSQLCTLKGNWKGRKVQYDEGGVLPKKRSIGVVLVCYDAYGTLQTDNIASCAYNYNFNFKDM